MTVKERQLGVTLKCTLASYLVLFGSYIFYAYKTLLSTFRCTNGDFYVALGSSTGLALLVWVGGGLLKRVLYFFGNESSLGQKSPILRLPH